MIAEITKKWSLGPMDIDQMDDIAFIKRILMRDYHLTGGQADKAIRVAGIRSFFKNDPDMASHDSHQQWGEYAYKCWKGSQDARLTTLTSVAQKHVGRNSSDLPKRHRGRPDAM
ncbi:MAG: hypothetical protein J6J87_07540 [Oscillospiraceae bacterium]|nr:hypothetical protein [Oscillospiraceae bacterium]